MLAAVFAEVVVECLVGDGGDADGSVAGFVAEFVDGLSEAVLGGRPDSDVVLLGQSLGHSPAGGGAAGAVRTAGRSGMSSAGWLVVRVMAGLRVVVMRVLRW